MVMKTRFRMECLIVFDPHKCQEREAKRCPKTETVYANYRCPEYLCTVSTPSTIPSTETVPSTSLYVSTVETTIKSTSTTLETSSMRLSSQKLLFTTTTVKHFTTTLEQSSTSKMEEATVSAPFCASSNEFYKIWAMVASGKMRHCM